MKKIFAKKVLLGVLLALVTTSAVGCVVADRPYYYGPYGSYELVQPLDRYAYHWYRDYYRWHRDHNRSDRD